MRNYRKSGMLAMICIVLLLTFADSRAEDTSPEPTEYELMSMLIDSEYEAEFNLILSNRETETWCLGGQIAVLQKTWPRLKNETIDALIVNNRGATYRFDEQFRLPVDYELISEQEYLKVLRNGRMLKAGGGTGSTGIDQYASANTDERPDWDNFDKVFPDAQGYLTFSRAGFDSERTQALVIFSNSYRCSGNNVNRNSIS